MDFMKDELGQTVEMHQLGYKRFTDLVTEMARLGHVTTANTSGSYGGDGLVVVSLGKNAGHR